MTKVNQDLEMVSLTYPNCEQVGNIFHTLRGTYRRPTSKRFVLEPWQSATDAIQIRAQ